MRRLVLACDLRLALLGLLASVMLFTGLGASSFHDEDEALYAEVAQEMLRDGDVLTPHFWSEPFLHKPPLSFWILALAERTIPGSPEFRARFPAALSGVLLVLLTAIWARRLGGWTAAWVSAMLLLFNQQFLFEHAARSATIDAEVALFSLTALYAGARAAKYRSAAALSALSLAALAMLKSVVAGFAFFPVALTLFFHDRPAWRRWLLCCVGAGVLFVLPWHLMAWMRHGQAFIDTYLIYEHLGRLAGTATARYPGRWVHLEALWQAFLPWTPLVALSFSATWLSQGERPKTRFIEHNTEHRLLAGYAIFLLIVLSLVRAKWGWYTLPLLAVFSILTGVFVATALQRRKLRGLLIALGSCVLLRLLLLAPNASYHPAERVSAAWPSEDPLYILRFTEPSFAVVVALAALLALALWAMPRRATGRRRLLVAAMALLPFVLCVRDLVTPERDGEHPAAVLARTLAAAHYETVFVSGFRHQARYAGRMAPLESYYLLSRIGARIVDLSRHSDGTWQERTERCALVVASGSDLPTQAASSACELWSYDPSWRPVVRRLSSASREARPRFSSRMR